MLSKRARGYDPSLVDSAKRLRLNLADAYLSNDITGVRTQELFNDAAAAGAANVADIASKDKPRNAARNLKRKFLKNTKWPTVYTSLVSMKDPKTEEARAKQKINMLIYFTYKVPASCTGHEAEAEHQFGTRACRHAGQVRGPERIAADRRDGAPHQGAPRESEFRAGG